MTNVNVSTSNNHKLIISQRFFLALAVGVALWSLFLFGSGHYHRLSTKEDAARLVGPDVLYSPFLMDSHAVSVLRELELMQDHAAHPFGTFNLRAALLTQPQFAVHETDQAVTVTVQVPETIRLEDIQVQVREGSILHIQGHNNKNKNSYVSFEKTFALGRHMDADSITASLSETGVLTVSAPKFAKKQEDSIRTIDITKTEF